MTNLETFITQACSRVIIVLLALFIFPSIAFSQSFDQSIFPVQGDFDESTTMSLSWTLGDIAISTIESGEEIFTQGFQQSFIQIRERPDYKMSSINAYAYPNPAQKEITLHVANENAQYSITLYDAIGRLLLQITTTQSKQTIDLENYDEGLYIVKIKSIESNNQSVFEILKF